MRVAVDMHFLQDKHQGIKTVLVGLYEAVIRRNTNHEFIFIFFEKDEVSDYWRQFGEVVFIGRLSRNARLSYGMANAVKRIGGVDLSHFNAVVPVGVRGKILLTVHDVLFMTHPQYFDFLFRMKQRVAVNWSLRRADVVAIGSEYSMEVLVRLFPNQAKKFRLLKNSVDVSAYNAIDPVKAASEVKHNYGLENYILTVGRIDPRKNHITMLKAYEELAGQVSPDRLPAFVVVGEMDNGYHKGHDLIKNLSSNLPVVWLRGIDDEALRNLYKAAKFVVMVSHAEGFGLPIVEAMSAGTPVIAGDNTSMPEVLGDCGCLIDSNDVGQLARAYHDLLNDDMLRTRYSSCGLARVRTMDWNHRAERYLAILDEVSSMASGKNNSTFD